MPEQIENLMRDARIAVALSQAEFARRSKYPVNKLNRVIAGDIWPQDDTLEKMAVELSKHPDHPSIDRDFLAIALREKRIQKRLAKSIDF